MRIEYFLDQMLEKINQVELNLYIEDISGCCIDKEG